MSEARRPGDRALWGLLVLFALTAVAFVGRTWSDGDEGRYLSLARAVATGQGQVAAYLPQPRPETLTPPGYVWYLALLHRMSSGSMLAMRLGSLAAFVLAGALFVRMLRADDRLSPVLRAAAVAAGLFPVVYLSFAWQLMSEALFFLALFGALWALARARDRGGWADAALAGAFAGLSLLVRPAGLALLVAGVLHLALRRRFRPAAVFAAVAVACYLPAVVRTVVLSGSALPHLSHFEGGAGGVHESPLRVAAESIVQSFPRYFFFELPRHQFFSLFDHRSLLTRLHLGFAAGPLALAAALLVLAGSLARLRRPDAAVLFWWVYWPLLCAYNQPDYRAAGTFFYQPRYLIPLLPLAAVYLCEGLALLARPWAARLRKDPAQLAAGPALLAAAYVLLTGLGAAGVRLRNERPLWRYDDFAPERQLVRHNELDAAFGRYLESARWIGDHAPPDAAVASRKPDHVWLVSGARGFRYDAGDAEKAAHDIWSHMLEQGRGRPLLILQDAFPAETGYGRTRVNGLDPVLEAHRGELELLHETAAPVTRIWRVRPAAALPAP